MKRIAFLVILVMGLGVCAWAQATPAPEQDLGSVARKSRTQKQGTSRKVWTNDDFPSSASSSSAMTVPSGSAEAPSAPQEANGGAQEAKAEDPVERQKALDAEWSNKISAEKARLAALERELSLLDREYRLKAATYYADAGNRLRDPRGWADTEQGFREKNNELRQQINDLKASIEEMQEEARKAGVSSGARE